MIPIIILTFVIGYLLIAMEHNIHIDKSAPALIVGVLCWTAYICLTPKDHHVVTHELYEYLGEISGVLFFLLGAMTIVELIDVHHGFDLITGKISTSKQSSLLWIISLATFFLSAALDNLTTTIVMISVLRKLIPKRDIRIFFISVVVIAANAGGAWSPIGDVTTTMLWIGGQVTTVNIIVKLILPSLVCLIIPVAIATNFLSSNTTQGGMIGFGNVPFSPYQLIKKNEQLTVLLLGISTLLFVPIFKTLTGLPPFMGILLGLGVIWFVTEIMHKDKSPELKGKLSVIYTIKKVDVAGVLFFFGILVAISSLQATGILKSLAVYMDETIGNIYAIGLLLGLLSAVVDNVPLVAAAIGMYDLSVFPTNHWLWEFIAYCAGTGGSALIIGSAAGVAAMGMEKIGFGWYIKKISWLALAGYFGGAITYMLIQLFLYS